MDLYPIILKKYSRVHVRDLYYMSLHRQLFPPTSLYWEDNGKPVHGLWADVEFPE